MQGFPLSALPLPVLFLVLQYAGLTLCQGSIVTIDDSDPRIQYGGAWIPNPGSDPQMNNFDGTLTFTNVSGSTATVSFTGSAVAVYGAFEPGTFNVLSSYAVDDGASTVFQPATTNTQWLYRRPFFQSGPISDGQHTLVITNLGNRFWFDFIQVEVDAADASTSTPMQSPSPSSDTSSQRNQGSSATPNTPTTSMGVRASGTAPSSVSATTIHESRGSTSASASQLTALGAPGSSAVHNIPVSTATTSTAGPELPTGSGSTTTTDSLTVASPTMVPGAIVGVTVAGSVLVLLVVGGWWWWRRRQRAARKDSIVPFASSGQGDAESSDIESSLGKSKLTLRSEIFSANSDTIVHMSSPVDSHDSSVAHVDVPTEAVDIVDADNLLSTGQSIPEVVELSDGEKHATYPRALPAVPIIPREPLSPPFVPPQGAYYLEYNGRSSMTPLSPRPVRRRSVDGGVRIAGGPLERPGYPTEDETRSDTGTLPPLYQLHAP
ncbi:hypothetical protein BD311DRAFT_145029 [Dichomitus squalens]|uniref:Uncharacterized protein n=1 Tax=Dichomitus squalens TaxID=114155 RepID=A0A4Q9M7Q0_9APHY|nr:hypothetical protein BD311DRAFT_145029 [Dichomitus squalens]